MQTTHKITCWKCKSVHLIKVFDRDYIAWKSGKYIQDVMPYLSADDRELFISGICGECYDKLYDKEI